MGLGHSYARLHQPPANRPMNQSIGLSNAFMVRQQKIEVGITPWSTYSRPLPYVDIPGGCLVKIIKTPRVSVFPFSTRHLLHLSAAFGDALSVTEIRLRRCPATRAPDHPRRRPELSPEADDGIGLLSAAPPANRSSPMKILICGIGMKRTSCGRCRWAWSCHVVLDRRRLVCNRLDEIL